MQLALSVTGLLLSIAKGSAYFFAETFMMDHYQDDVFPAVVRSMQEKIRPEDEVSLQHHTPVTGTSSLGRRTSIDPRVRQLDAETTYDQSKLTKEAKKRRKQRKRWEKKLKKLQKMHEKYGIGNGDGAPSAGYREYAETGGGIDPNKINNKQKRKRNKKGTRRKRVSGILNTDGGTEPYKEDRTFKKRKRNRNQNGRKRGGDVFDGDTDYGKTTKRRKREGRIHISEGVGDLDDDTQSRNKGSDGRDRDNDASLNDIYDYYNLYFGNANMPEDRQKKKGKTQGEASFDDDDANTFNDVYDYDDNVGNLRKKRKRNQRNISRDYTNRNIDDDMPTFW